MKKQKINVKYPIVVKLILIISVIVFISAGVVSLIASWRFSDDIRARVEKNNLDMNEMQATQVTNSIDSIVSNIYLLFDTFRTIMGNRILETATIDNFWLRNGEVAAIILPGEKELYNNKFFLANELDRDVITPLIAKYKSEQDKAKTGGTFLFNASNVFGFPVVGLIIPYKEFGTNNGMIIIFSVEELQARITASSSVYNTFIVNSSGDIILHEELDKLTMGVNIKTHPVVKDMFANPIDNRQIKYRETDGNEYFGAYRKLSTGGLGVITTIPTSEVSAVVRQIIMQNLYLTGVVLLFSILITYFFSKTISKPVRALARATLKIESGDYEPDIRPTTRDELGSLTESFIHMSRGLAERERIKTTFGKFVNKSIAEQALSGKLTLGGVRREATIFFSDIRSFTAISEALSPEQVVEFLNDYMSRMVHCVNETDGVVDKFIGDAIMALWGVPVSKGSPEADALNAVTSALMMRGALIDFNKGRGGEDKPLIKIGCGLNTGPAIAGQIGSEQRMEYTVIGDAVNLASRIEALNKPFGTDILISENTYLLLKDKVIVEPMSPIKVKGKAQPLQIYAVVNLTGMEGPKTLADVRNLVGIKPPEAAPDVDKEEVKYEILDDKKKG